MHVGHDGFFDLTYCTNIHPANGWDEVFGNLQKHVPALKAAMATRDDFGIGLRLSNAESSELLQEDHLRQFQGFLRSHRLYVSTLNGFPYGSFHLKPVKAQVHAPDWRDEERVRYTMRLIKVLSALLPKGIDGSISTSPLSYKPWVSVDDPLTWRDLTRNIVRIADALVKLRQNHGKSIHLDIEPEPDGLLENSEQVLSFYENYLLKDGAQMLSEFLDVSSDEARRHLLEYIRICFDTCHAAVSYEDPATVLDRFDKVGIKIGKIQISSGMMILFPDEEKARTNIASALAPFAESVYLHQVTQQNQDGTFRHHADLTEALQSILDPRIAEWRIHFHVPLFVDRYGIFSSTQDTVARTLELLAQRRFCQQLEIETYTWSVLPEGLKKDLVDSIAREYRWVLSRMFVS